MTRERQAATVALVHGLGRSVRSMQTLATRLTAAGFAPSTLDYPSRSDRLDVLIDLVAERLADLAAGDGPLHAAGHSMGGLILRGALARLPRERLGRLVMIGSPNQGVRLLARLGRLDLLARVFGAPVHDLVRGAPALQRLATPPMETGCIAGTRAFAAFSPAAYASFLLFPFTPRDGTVEVESVRFAGMADFVTVPASHMFMCDHPEVVRQTIHFLQHGRFAPDEAAPLPAARRVRS